MDGLDESDEDDEDGAFDEFDFDYDSNPDMDTQVTVSRLPLNVPTYQNQYKGHVSCGK